MGADMVIYGPPPAGNINPWQSQSIVHNHRDNELYTSGQALKLDTIQMTKAVALALTPAPAVSIPLLSAVFAAGSLNLPGRMLRARVRALIATSSSSIVSAITLALGGVSLISPAGNAGITTPTVYDFELTLHVNSLGATAQVEGEGMTMGAYSGTSAVGYVQTATSTPQTVNLLQPQTLTLAYAATGGTPTSVNFRSIYLDLLH